MSSKFNHPAYKQMSLENRRIVSLTNNQVQDELKRHGLGVKGTRPILTKRLKHYSKQRILTDNNLVESDREAILPDYYVVLDFEATCEEFNADGYRHEIIEFPAILLNRRTLQTEAEFRSYCCPNINPDLSEFCISLTGITQDDVNSAPVLKEVLVSFDKWIARNITDGKSFFISTDGPWDVNKFLRPQCEHLGITLPEYWREFVNIRKHFTNFYKISQNTVETMLLNLGTEFIGRQHCGADDTKNIARILANLLEDGCLCLKNDVFRALSY